MRKIVGVVLILMLIAGTAYAKGGSGEKGKKRHGYKEPVVVEAIGFSAVYRNGVVKTHWKKYLRDDLKYYKVVRSNVKADPVYPEDGYVFYSEDPGSTSFTDSKVKPGTWFYRVCIITRPGDRWVSPVVRVEVEKSERGAPTARDFE